LANLFSDGFESGSFAAWSSVIIDGGDLYVSNAAALVGNYGMAALLDDNNAIYVQDDTPNSEKRYRFRFYFDPNSITMAEGDSHYLLMAYKTGGITPLIVQFRYALASGGYLLRLGVQNDSAGYHYTTYTTISDQPHYVEIDWKASSAPGANDGFGYIWIDGASEKSVTGIDNDTFAVDYVQMGAVLGIDIGTRGTYYFDAFASNNDGSLIGEEIAALYRRSMAHVWALFMRAARRKKHGR
jgi:hypothetical protein